MPRVSIDVPSDINARLERLPFGKTYILVGLLKAQLVPDATMEDDVIRIVAAIQGKSIVATPTTPTQTASPTPTQSPGLSPTPTPTQSPGLSPTQTASPGQSSGQTPTQNPKQNPAQPPSLGDDTTIYTFSTPDGIDPAANDNDRRLWAQAGFVPTPGLRIERLRKLGLDKRLRGLAQAERDKKAQAELAAVERERINRLKNRGYREHDIQDLETLRKLGTAANPVMQAIQTNSPPAEPGEFPEIRARTYECIGPGGTKYPLTKEEWEAIKDEMSPGMMEAFATRDEWFHRPTGLFPWQMMVKAWILHADHSHSRSHFIPKERPKFWSLNATYTKNEPGFEEVGPHGTTFSHYCFHSDFFGGDKRFQWVRRYKVREPIMYMNFSFHDIIKALGCEQFLIWLVDMDLPHALHKQWTERGRWLDKEKIDKDADGFDMDRHYVEFPPEMGFTVHEGHLWVNIVALHAMKETVMRMMGDEGYDEFAEWVSVVDVGGYNRLIKGMVDDPDVLAASMIPRRREGIIDPSEFVEVTEELKPVLDSGESHDRASTE